MEKIVVKEIEQTTPDNLEIKDAGKDFSEQTSPNLFTFSSIEIGSTYGAMTTDKVSSADSFHKEVQAPPNEHSLAAQFSGEAILVGTLSAPTGDPRDGGIGPEYSVSELTIDSIQKLPRSETDTRMVWFGIDNPEMVTEAGLKNGDRVEIVIDKYLEYKKAD